MTFYNLNPLKMNKLNIPSGNNTARIQDQMEPHKIFFGTIRILFSTMTLKRDLYTFLAVIITLT